MSRRNKPRINYSILNSTGNIVHQTEYTSSPEDLSIQLDQLTLEEMPSSVVINTQVLIQEVFDIIDENPIHIGADYTGIVKKLTEIRQTIRKN